MIDEDIIAKIDRHIEVVTTETAGMKETGFGSVETCRTVCDILRSCYTQVRFNNVRNERDLKIVVDRQPDLVVLCVKYIAGEGPNGSIWLSDYFSRYGVPHTGSDRATLEFDSDKSKAKSVLLKEGVATANFFFASPGLFKQEEQLPLPLPLFVKPLDAANGNGVDENSLVHDFASYEAKVAEISAVYRNHALVEEVLPGREFTVAILDDPLHSRRLISPVEIVGPKNAKGDRVLGCLEKSGNREYISKVSEPTLTAVSNLAGEAFSVLGARDFGRIDVKLDGQGVPHFIEANLVPGMTPETSYFPRACNIEDTLPYECVVLRIVELALNRVVLPVHLVSTHVTPGISLAS